MNEKKNKPEEVTLTPIDKKPIKEVWYKRDAELRREKVIKTISEVSNLSTTLKEIILYAEHLHKELAWNESILTAMLKPYAEAGIEKEVMKEWETLILNQN